MVKNQWPRTKETQRNRNKEASNQAGSEPHFAKAIRFKIVPKI